MHHPSPDILHLRAQVAALPPCTETWDATLRRTRTWVAAPVPDAPPSRPWTLLILISDGSKLVAQHLWGATPPPDDTLIISTLQAMLQPADGAGSPRRPAALICDSAALGAVLAPHLDALGIDCQMVDQTDTIQTALHVLETFQNQRPARPGLLTVPGATPALIAHLFALAADYARLAPWRWFTDRHIFAIRVPPDAPPRYAVVMGMGGESYGLSVHDSWDDLHLILCGFPPAFLVQRISHVALSFDNPLKMRDDDLDAQERLGWPVADADHYPMILRLDHRSGNPAALPSLADLHWLEAALAALIRSVRQRKRHPARLTQPSHVVISVEGVEGVTQVGVQLIVWSPPFIIDSD